MADLLLLAISPSKTSEGHLPAVSDPTTSTRTRAFDSIVKTNAIHRIVPNGQKDSPGDQNDS